MAKFNYHANHDAHDAYDAYRYAIYGQKPEQKFRNTYDTLRIGYFDNEPVEISCELQCDARQFAKLFTGHSKNELYRSHKEEIKRVIFNEPYTIVIWANGEKTIVKAQDGEPYDKEKGLAMCFAKYALGNTCRYFDFFKEVCDEVEDKKETDFNVVSWLNAEMKKMLDEESEQSSKEERKQKLAIYGHEWR